MTCAHCHREGVYLSPEVEGERWCRMHYRRWKRTGSVDGKRRTGCDVEDCKDPHKAHGLCEKHLWRWKTNGTVDLERTGKGGLRGTCSVDGCDQPHCARGWCRKHWTQWKRTGSTAFEVEARIASMPREKRDEVVRRLTRAGASAKDIGQRLGVSNRTVVRTRKELGIQQDTWNDKEKETA